MDSHMDTDFNLFFISEAAGKRLSKVQRHRRAWHGTPVHENESALENAVNWVNRLMDEDSSRPDTVRLLRRILRERIEAGVAGASR